MTAEEFIIQQWNKCIWFNHDDYPGNIIMIYDKQHDRKMKLNSLNDSNDEIKFIESIDSVVLFYQDYKNGYLDVDYDDIWIVLQKKYGINYQGIVDVIMNTLLHNKLIKLKFLDNKLKKLMPSGEYLNYHKKFLLEDKKLNKI